VTGDQGRPPAGSDPAQRTYLLSRLEEVRKDCQWLVGIGAASVFGVVVGGAIGTASMRKVTFCIVALQMLIAFAGATSFLRCRVDKAEVLQRLRRTLVTRYWLRNASLFLLLAAFLWLGSSVLF
jgi:hypothetical protein